MRIDLSSMLWILAASAVPAFARVQTCKGAPARNEGDFVHLANGTQVYDTETGLIWMRCIERSLGLEAPARQTIRTL